MKKQIIIILTLIAICLQGCAGLSKDMSVVDNQTKFSEVIVYGTVSDIFPMNEQLSETTFEVGESLKGEISMPSIYVRAGKGIFAEDDGTYIIFLKRTANSDTFELFEEGSAIRFDNNENSIDCKEFKDATSALKYIKRGQK